MVKSSPNGTASTWETFVDFAAGELSVRKGAFGRVVGRSLQSSFQKKKIWKRLHSSARIRKKEMRKPHDVTQKLRGYTRKACERAPTGLPSFPTQSHAALDERHTSCATASLFVLLLVALVHGIALLLRSVFGSARPKVFAGEKYTETAHTP